MLDLTLPCLQGNVILQIITEFCADFRTAIDGNNRDLSLNELSGGARISYVFHELFSNGVKSIDPFDQVKDHDIRNILYNSSVRKGICFVAENCVSYIPRLHAGVVSSAFCGHYCVRSHHQAADQAHRGAKFEMCLFRL
jgi:hypothetical protein